MHDCIDGIENPCVDCVHFDTDDGACEYCVHGPAIDCHFEVDP